MKRLGVLTTGRQDYGILRSTLLMLSSDPRFELLLYVGGMHLLAGHGDSVREIEADGLSITRQLRLDSQGSANQAAEMVTGLSAALREDRPEALLLVGDRSETAAAGLAAVLSQVPIVHLHGGEETEGAVDNVLRHALTKMSNLHLVSHPLHARRIVQMGEAASNVHLVGAPGLDALRREAMADRATLQRALGIALEPPVVVVTFHPTTLGHPEQEVRELVAAMGDVPATYVITLPNNDDGADRVRAALSGFCNATGRATAVESLGPLYFPLLAQANAVLGNSSSALIEAPIFELPSVNVGERQTGRLRGDNVIDVPAERTAIAAGLARALDPAFRASLRGMASPFGDGRSAPRIVELLASWAPPSPPRKRFVDLEVG
jgi:UDP-hydrolysing UDP-N-acetyl-D-glucosamine 2-epimerase